MMKKLVHAGKVLTIASLIALTGCKKDSKTAFPSQPTTGGSVSEFAFGTPYIYTYSDADAVLASVHVHNYKIVTISPVETEYQFGVAMFTNTMGNFSSLVDVDSVWINGYNCDKNSSLAYQSNATTYTIGLGGTVRWQTKSAGSFVAKDTTFAAGDPTYSYFSISNASYPTVGYWSETWLPTYPRTLTTVTTKPTNVIAPPNGTAADSVRWENDSTTFKTAMALYQTTLAQHNADSIYNLTPYAYIPLRVTGSSGTTNYVTNTDSVIVIYNDNAGFIRSFHVPATDSTVALRPNDFLGYPAYKLANMTMQINLCKYYPSIVGTKKYYYVKMGSYVRYWRTN